MQRRQRRLLAGLQHEGIPRGEGRRDLPREHHQRNVPRYDLPDYADGFVARVSEEVAV